MIEMHVEGMNCNHCVSKVTRSVREIDPNASVDVDLKGRTVRVQSGAAPEQITSAITEAGYPVTACIAG
jgi:copper chaperone CopZ